MPRAAAPGWPGTARSRRRALPAWDPHSDRGALAGRAVHSELTVQRAGPVPHVGHAAAAGAGAADAVVADLDLQGAVGHPDLHAGLAGPGVLDHVGEGL